MGRGRTIHVILICRGQMWDVTTNEELCSGTLISHLDKSPFRKCSHLSNCRRERDMWPIDLPETCLKLAEFPFFFVCVGGERPRKSHYHLSLNISSQKLNDHLMQLCKMFVLFCIVCSGYLKSSTARTLVLRRTGNLSENSNAKTT